MGLYSLITSRRLFLLVVQLDQLFLSNTMQLDNNYIKSFILKYSDGISKTKADVMFPDKVNLINDSHRCIKITVDNNMLLVCSNVPRLQNSQKKMRHGALGHSNIFEHRHMLCAGNIEMP